MSEERYEHARPGDLLHVDVKKLGGIPDGGGWRLDGDDASGHTTATGTGRSRKALQTAAQASPRR